MSQTIKTLCFIAVAAVSIVVAAGTYYSQRPVDLNDFVDVGEKFYPDFEDPNVATGLQVAAYQDATGKTELFKVDVKDGLWCIPSHHDYPADAQDRLAKTAASMVGVVRLALVDRTKLSHKKRGVVDPLDKNASTEGRGDRITLYKGNDVLVDFIVGEKVENSESLYYVRRADEERVYTADLGRFNVSTKFADWIKKDVLEMSRNDVREIIIGRYHVDELQGKVIQQGKIELKKPESGDWEMVGLKSDHEKLKVSEVNTLLTSLDDLQIAGVRKKPAGLSAGLKGDSASISIDPLVQHDLAEKGVFISGRGDFVYNEGKVNVGLSNGVMYELGFGEQFTGSDLDIEIGKQPSPAAEAEKDAKEIEAKPAKEGDKSEAAEDEKKSDEAKTSRYLFVTAYFDKTLLGPEPVAPVKPEAPKEEAAKADKPEEKPAADADKKPDAANADAAKSEESKDAPKDAKAKGADPKVAYEKALEEYKLQQEVYEQKKKDYEARVKSGNERVAELNRRFADWYYVIPEDIFTKLKLNRDELVEKVEAPEPPAEPAAPAKEPAQEEAAKKEDAKPAGEMKSAPAEKASENSGDKPAEKPEEKKPESAPAEKMEAEKKAPEKQEPGKPEAEKKEPEKKEDPKPAESKPAADEKPAPVEEKKAEEKKADAPAPPSSDK